MNNMGFLNNLDDLLKQNKFEEVDSLIDSFVPISFSESDIEATLNLIRSKRRQNTLEKAASLFIAHDYSHPQIKRFLSQALIEQGRFDQAFGILTAVEKKTSWPNPEKSEILGLMGRIKKQQFVETNNQEFLYQSIEVYQEGWNKKIADYRWHGINFIALKERAARDNIKGIDNSDTREIASFIIKEIDKISSPSVWDYATAMEASIALADQHKTMAWAKKYIAHPALNAFELGSTLRQLREIWQISDSPIAKMLEPVLEYEILQHRGGGVLITLNEGLDRSGFEAVYGHDGYTYSCWFENMISCTKSVAKILDKNTGKPYGTGFLIKGSDIHSDWNDELLLITNAHVVSNEPSDEAPLSPNRAIAEFTQLEKIVKLDLGSQCFHSPRYELDTFICKISKTEELSELSLSFYHPLVAEEGDKPQRIYVIGHPNGGGLVISLYDNDLVGYDPPYVHYTSPTDGGSSGSPVLSRDLSTFALHHKTKSELQVNEGVLMDEIREKLKSSSS